jgi:hypothetical protein
MRSLAITLVLPVVFVASAAAFQASTVSRLNSRVALSSRLFISNFFQSNSNESKTAPQLPKDVKDAVSKCRDGVQKGLEGRISRMDVEFPVGTKFGIERKFQENERGTSCCLPWLQRITVAQIVVLQEIC